MSETAQSSADAADESPPAAKKKRWRPGLATQVLLGMGLGIAAGIVFGEWMASLELIGNVFIGLLQMTVLPYIVVSLVLSLGRLSFKEVRLLARKGGVLVLLFWGLGLIIIIGMTAGFPNWPSATFFSTSMIEQREALDPVRLYVPANPFFALTNGIVPAIVLFSIALGLALVHVPGKEYLLKNLDLLSDAIMRIAQFVVRLAPLGVFALVASAAGTMSVEELGRLQVYLLTYVGAALLLSLWVLPGLVSALTPIPFRRVISATQDALITAFATYNLLIVLPLLSERIKELLEEADMLNPDTEGAADLVVPINFNLPNLGKLLALGFIPFAGWFAGSTIGVGQYPKFLISGLFSFFGEVVVALPFLLDLMQIPADTFQIFLVVDQFAGRFGTLLAGMHTVVLGILTAAAVTGGLRLAWGKLLRHLAISAVLAVAVFGGLRLFFEYVVPQEYRQFRVLEEMDPVLKNRVPARMLTVDDVEPLVAREGRSRVQAIKQRGTLRVGYVSEALPFAYRQDTDELVGIDVDIMQMIARETEVGIDFVQLQNVESVGNVLQDGRVDVVIGGLFGTPGRAVHYPLSKSYMNATLSLVVPDYRRREFASWRQVREMPSPKIAMLDIPYFQRRAQLALPNVEIQVVPSARAFFEAPSGTYDALVYSAEAGSAWTLLYPQYSVVIPEPGFIAVPLVFALPPDEPEFKRFVDTWIALNESSGTMQRLYDYWILGQGSQGTERRWSVVHNVLGWGGGDGK